MKKLLTLSVILFSIQFTFANVSTPQIDTTKPLPQLSSINQLGELSFNTPTMHRLTVDGVEVLVTPIDSLPIVDISVHFQAGSAYDETIKKGGFGISNLVATLLTKGTNRLDEDAFIAKSEQLGISLFASSSKDFLSVNLRSLSDPKTLTPALELMGDALHSPAFNKDTLARYQDELITGLAIREQNPSYVASVAYTQALFGSHPYGHAITGNKNSLKLINSDDLKKFKNTYFNQQNMRIVITGNISINDARQIAQTLIHKLPKGTIAPTLPIAKKPKASHIHIDFPSTQTQIILGQLSSPFSNNKEELQSSMNFDIANEVLAGGEFSARLMDEIRVKKGYTYGIYGSDSKLSAAGIYTIRFSTQSKDATNAIKDTLKVIKDTQKTGIRDDELSLTLFNSKHSYPNSFSSNAGIHSIASTMIMRELPEDYLQTYLDRLNQVTKDNTNTALKLINPNDFIIISVGSEKPKIK